MWLRGWREALWSDLKSESWDLVIVGGGITGAGIFSEATRLGVRTLLVEAGDFASGTSSRSSKLVHGGLRYLRNGQVGLTRESVVERERLLREGAGLVTPLGFYLTNFETDRTQPWLMGAGLAVYDILAAKWAHKTLTKRELLTAIPELQGAPLVGGFYYMDAQTDDARLTLRVIREGVRRGGRAINYARVVSLLRTNDGKVRGIVLRDEASRGSGGEARTVEIQAPVVINATGAFADDLRVGLGKPRRLRKIRGSHLVLKGARFPLKEAVCMMHPRDNRAIFGIPWEGVTIYGTTDADHFEPDEVEPFIGMDEAEYLIEGLRYAFPRLNLQAEDVITTIAGVRAVVDTGKKDPSKESREHVLWNEDGLLTVTGGKLTTFRIMARDALRAVLAELPEKARVRRTRGRILDENPEIEWPDRVDALTRVRLVGRLGADAAEVARMHSDLQKIHPDGVSIWAEIRWAARAEGVVHLEDLLLRRVRLGLLSPRGGRDHFKKIKKIVQEELGWSDEEWTREAAAYETTWKSSYSMRAARPAKKIAV